MRLLRIARLIIVLAACDAGEPCKPPPVPTPTIDEAGHPEFGTDHEPSAAEVASFLSRNYLRPQLVKVTLDRADSAPYLTLREWNETYGGIAVLRDVKSVQLRGWRTRFHASLREPELPDRNRLLGESIARSRANIPASTSGRLVYVPRFAQRIRATAGAPKAEDYYLVIDGYDLAYDFDGPNAFVRVDAYAGTVKRISRWVD